MLVVHELVHRQQLYRRHAKRLQVAHQGADPDFIGRPVQQAVYRLPHSQQAKDELQADIPNRAGAPFFGADRHHRTCHAPRQELLVGRGFVAGVNEIPPGNLFVLGHSPFLTGGEKNQQTIDVKKNFRVREAKFRPHANRSQRHNPVLQCLRVAGDSND